LYLIKKKKKNGCIKRLKTLLKTIGDYEKCNLRVSKRKTKKLIFKTKTNWEKKNMEEKKLLLLKLKNCLRDEE